ncbi:MAG: hypothetical protein E6J12_06830 [Chloroflexi bacterium]|nr:MAG: hypothetical protein E6J12_06830 [Chloroflexota bacterium]
MATAIARTSSEVDLLMQAVERFSSSPHQTIGQELAVDLVQVRHCVDLIELKFSAMASAPLPHGWRRRRRPPCGR